MEKIEVGTTYSDPDGEWEVIARNENGTYDVKCIGGTKVESNIGFVGFVTEEEIRYFMENGF